MYIMTNTSLLDINLSSPILFYQNPVDIYETQTGSTQMNGVPSEIYSCRSCNTNLASNNPASQYQRQKLIQNTVRVYSSLYTMNLAGLAGYKKPLNTPQFVEQNGSGYIAPAKVYWNQMSDRPRPANQVTKVASGSSYHTSSTRHTITRHRPGAMSPGGVGVDIKHNSYDRYLNRLKGKSSLRRGIIPPDYGSPIPFNMAFPVYGGKIVKTSIINGCDCPDIEDNREQDKRIYASTLNAIQDKIFSVKYVFNVGDFVWAKKYETDPNLYKGQIKSILNGFYTVQFDDVTRTLTYDGLFIYFSCNECNIQLPLKEELFISFPNQKLIQLDNSTKSALCEFVNII
jgi:hypothetical protein